MPWLARRAGSHHGKCLNVAHISPVVAVMQSLSIWPTCTAIIRSSWAVNHPNHNLGIRAAHPAQLIASRLIGGCIEHHAVAFQPAQNFRPGLHIVFPDAAGKDHGIQATQ